jgi:phosphoglycolate phosphatase-like HAD superfamily hydrolase
LSDKLIQILSMHEEMNASHVLPEPGAHQLLDAIRHRGYRCGLVSNNNILAIEKTLKNLGFMDYFGAIFGRANNISELKPSTAFIERAANRFTL